MAVFKCKICGGALDIYLEMTVGKCQFCGTVITLPRISSDKRANLYERANEHRRANEYDRAMGIYETILSEDPGDAEAYWSLVLCRYGVEYVEDPKTRKMIPICNRASTASVLDDRDYLNAIAHAEGEAKALYEEDARAIDAIRKGILEIAVNEKPFDVFICCKETDELGHRTPDSVIAQEIYEVLAQNGWRAFFSRITLKDKPGTEYEPYIFAALHSAEIMIVIGTKREYFEEVWVKNEWSRYLALIKGGAQKTLIPAYRDMRAEDLPSELRRLQAQNLGELGFLQDLIRGMDKIKKPRTNVLAKYHHGLVIVCGRQYNPEDAANFDFDDATRTITGYSKEPEGILVIPYGVRKIAPQVFMNCGKITKIVIMEDIFTEFGEEAFRGCVNLEEIGMPEKLKTVREGVFADCTAITKLDFNESLRTIKKNAFSGCTGLKNILFPDEFKTIEENAFACCTALESMTIPGKVSVADGAFAGCVNVKNVNITGEILKPLTWLKPFFEVKPPRIALEDIEVFDSNAYMGCDFLQTIKIPSSVDSIGKGALSSVGSRRSVEPGG
jgi:hypothetical protein